MRRGINKSKKEKGENIMKKGDKYLGTNCKIKFDYFVVLRIYTHILYISNSLYILLFILHALLCCP